MKFIKTDIVNFRSIKHQTVLFEPTCRVLVGINESGKSNVLAALSHLNYSSKLDPENDVRESLPGEDEVKESYIEFHLRFEKNEANEIFSDVTKKILCSAKDPVIARHKGDQLGLKTLCNKFEEVVYKVDILNKTREFLYTSIVGEKNEYILIGNWRKVISSVPESILVHDGDNFFPLYEYSLIRIDDFSDVPNDYLEKATFNDLDELIGEVCIDNIQFYIPETLFWEYDEKNLLPSQLDISEFAANPKICIPLQNMFALAGITDIKQEIQRIKNLSRNQIQNFFDRVASKTTDHFRYVWKEYKGIEFKLRVDSNKIIPAIKEQNSFDLSKRSDGFKRFVTFLLMISVKVKTDNLKDTLLLIDEPDSNLHPSGARFLRDELIRISSKNCVIYSTHSIFMIDAENIGRHYIVKKKDEITCIEVAKDSNITDEEVIFNALGFSVFEFFKERNIIFEGWKDKELFLTALDKASGEIKKKLKDMGICHAKGSKHIKTITPMIELGKRTCIIVSDSDIPAKEQQKLYRKEKGFGDWKTYQEIDSSITALTGEDFLKNDHIIKCLNTIITDFNLPPFKEINLSSNSGKLKSVELWLLSNGLTSAQAKDTIGELKELLFDNLSVKNIDSSYELLLKGLSSSF